jgi:hypothetical protein
MFMADYPIERVLEELVEKSAVTIEEFKLPNRMAYLVTDINKDKIAQLCRETSKDRPRKDEKAIKFKAKSDRHSAAN